MSSDPNSIEPDILLNKPGTTAGHVETVELLEEVLRVAKRQVETGRVQVSLLTDTEQREIRETLKTRRVEIERVTVDRQLQPGEAMPQSRTEGDILIVPIVEELLVVEKRLVVTEEVRIRIVHDHEEVTHTVPVRRQRAVIQRLASADDADVA